MDATVNNTPEHYNSVTLTDKQLFALSSAREFLLAACKRYSHESLRTHGWTIDYTDLTAAIDVVRSASNSRYDVIRAYNLPF